MAAARTARLRRRRRGRQGDGEPALIVDVDGSRGRSTCCSNWPAARRSISHKISVLALAEQYLGFIEEARRFRLELAADYLVMAAWLAYLKSRLLLPEPPKADEPTAEDLADALARRLQRLELIRAAAQKLVERTSSAATSSPAACPNPWW